MDGAACRVCESERVEYFVRIAAADDRCCLLDGRRDAVAGGDVRHKVLLVLGEDADDEALVRVHLILVLAEEDLLILPLVGFHDPLGVVQVGDLTLVGDLCQDLLDRDREQRLRGVLGGEKGKGDKERACKRRQRGRAGGEARGPSGGEVPACVG